MLLVLVGTTAQAQLPGYSDFSITSPKGEEGVRANDGNVTVQLSLQPALRSGHIIVLSVSGEGDDTTTNSRGLSIGLKNLSRGLHTISATVVDKDENKLINAEPVSFYVLRVGGG